MLLVKKFSFFIYFFWSEKGLEIKFNDALDEKETFFVHKNKVLQRLKNRIFPKGLTHAFGQKMQCFKFVFGQKRTRNKV